VLTDVLKKLHYQDSLKGVVLNAPETIAKELVALGLVTTFSAPSRFTILFVKNRDDLEASIKTTLQHIEDDSLLWIAYPKGSSSIKTDINRDKLWVLVKPYGYRPVAQVAIDNDWSTLRFRPEDKVKTKK